MTSRTCLVSFLGKNTEVGVPYWDFFFIIIIPACSLWFWYSFKAQNQKFPTWSAHTPRGYKKEFQGVWQRVACVPWGWVTSHNYLCVNINQTFPKGEGHRKSWEPQLYMLLVYSKGIHFDSKIHLIDSYLVLCGGHVERHCFPPYFKIKDCCQTNGF